MNTTATPEASRPKGLFSSSVYDKVKPHGEKPSVKRQKKDDDTTSDYHPGLARPVINKSNATGIREIFVEDDNIRDLRREQGFGKSDHRNEMRNMLHVLNAEVIGKGAIGDARSVYAASASERRDELAMHIACIPQLLDAYERAKSSRSHTGTFITYPRYVTDEQIDAFHETVTYMETNAKLTRLFFAKRMGRKAPTRSRDDFPNLIQLERPMVAIPAIGHFMTSAQQHMGMFFTQMYIIDKQMASISIAELYQDNSWIPLAKGAMIFMSRNEREFGTYILVQLYYEPSYTRMQLEEDAMIPHVAASRQILSTDPASALLGESNGDRLHELMLRYFAKVSKVQYHHVTYNDIYGDNTDNRSPLGAIMDSTCFRVQFLDAGFIPTVD